MNARPKILLVDDREENLVALEASLGHEDCELLRARSGPQALELLLTHEVALALIDVQMPEMDGFELAELMRGPERTRSIPIIFVTAGLHDQGRVFRGYESGAVDFLIKPLDTRVLRSKVGVFLQLWRQRQQLAARVAELEAVLAAVPAAVFIARDPESRRIDGNRHSEALLRLPPGSNLSLGALPPERRDGVRVLRDGREIPVPQMPVQTAARGEEVSGAEFDIALPDGELVHMLGNATPLRDGAGRVSGAVGAFVDVTELKRAQGRLLEADRRKDEFLAVLSHELRNPLMPIRNSVFVLHRAAPGGEQARRALEIIERQAGHLSRMVDDLLDVTRISRGKVQLRREPADLVELVRRTAEDHRAAFAVAGVELRVELPDAPLPTSVDTTRFSQVVGNLLGNAVKFTPRGGHVLLRLEREGYQGVLRVRDDGLGISEDVLGRLFQPFSQADRTLDRSRGGLGLGLAMVKSLTEMHGGQVTAHSRGPGQGAEFVVRLELAAEAPAPAPRAARGNGFARARPRVLIVEDNPDGAASLREAVELMGCEAEVAPDGPSALAIAPRLRPDLVLCDIGLPGMDGYEVARRLRSLAGLEATRLVAVTGYALPEDQKRALDAGFSEHLAKPPRLEAIERLLERLAPAPRDEDGLAAT